VVSHLQLPSMWSLTFSYPQCGLSPSATLHVVSHRQLPSMWSLTVSYPTPYISIHLRSKSCCITCTLFIYLYYFKLRTLHFKQITLVYNKQLNNRTKQGPSLATTNVLLGQKIPSLREAQIPTTTLTRTLTSDIISPHSHKCLRHVNVSFPFTPRSIKQTPATPQRCGCLK
jgi:hypothetical protein